MLIPDADTQLLPLLASKRRPPACASDREQQAILQSAQGFLQRGHLSAHADYDAARWNACRLDGIVQQMKCPFLLLHGGGVSSKMMEQLVGRRFAEIADRDGVVLVYPNAVDKHWNDGRGVKRYRSHRERIDDVGFLSALIDELVATMRDLVEVGVSILTLGQYLRPSSWHLPVVEYVPPQRFDALRIAAEAHGFLYVASGPLVRSSYRAGEFFLEGLLRKGAKPRDAPVTQATPA